MARSQIRAMWQFYAVLSVLAFGSSAGSFVIATAAVSNRFSRMRGRAISIVLLGPGFSGILTPVFVGLVFDITDSYRPAFVVLALLMALAIPLALTLKQPVASPTSSPSS